MMLTWRWTQPLMPLLHGPSQTNSSRPGHDVTEGAREHIATEDNKKHDYRLSGNDDEQYYTHDQEGKRLAFYQFRIFE